MYLTYTIKYNPFSVCALIPGFRCCLHKQYYHKPERPEEQFLLTSQNPSQISTQNLRLIDEYLL